MQIEVRPFEVDDFSGGITDNYVDAPANFYEEADNLLLVPFGEKAKPITRPGSDFHLAGDPQLPTGNQRIGELIAFDNDSTLFAQSAKKVFYPSSGAWVELTGPTGGTVFPAGSTSSTVSFASINKHLILVSDEHTSPMKIYKDAGGVLRVRNAGLPALASNPSVSIATAGSTSSYVYGFVYSFEYNVGTVAFEDQGAVTMVTTTSGAVIGGGNAASITAIPVLGASENRDTANIKVKIYRSKDTGSVLRYVGSVTNGTTTYSDTATDASLASAESIYVTGGVLDNDEPPKAALVHVIDGYTLYGHIKDGSTVYGNRLMQAVKDDPDSVPAEFLLEFDDDLVGISSFGSNPIVFTSRNIYRCEGFWDEMGRGGMTYVRISDSTGAINNGGIVQTNLGVFFAGSDGFYWTDGFRVQKISRDLNETYKTLTITADQKKRVRSDYDKKKRRVWWSFQSDYQGADVDVCYVLDLNFRTNNATTINEQMTFTTASGGSSFAPTAIRFFSGDLIRADSRGYVFGHGDDLLSDPLVDTGLSPSSWSKRAITYTYISAAFSFGTGLVRKWVPWCKLTFKNKTDLSVQVKSINDDHKSTKNLPVIRSRLNTVWGDPEATWSTPESVWNFDGFIEKRLRFPAGGLRCSYKQIEITNGNVVVSNSANTCSAGVNSFNKTAVLTDSANVVWNEDCVGMYLALENDGFEREYLIAGRTDDTITMDPTGATMPDGVFEWKIRGVPKNERIHLLSYVIHFAALTPTQEVFRDADTGESG